jgi:phage tail protein X
MESLAQGIRFVVGVGMVAAGSALAVPTCLHVFEITSQRPEQGPSPNVVVETPWNAQVTRGTPAVEMPREQQPTLPSPAYSQRLEYVPPPLPPEPLPPGPPQLAAATPELAPGYRPTLQSPPPPLLDAHAAPPLAVGWTPRASGPRAVVGPSPSPIADQPRIYVIRDGDDLTGIASRFYGHPTAAAAIWEANRGLLRDPSLLPIGAAIVLPPHSAVAALGRPTDHAMIEPAAQGRPLAPAPRDTVSHPASWLTGGAVSSVPAQPSP